MFAGGYDKKRGSEGNFESFLNKSHGRDRGTTLRGQSVSESGELRQRVIEVLLVRSLSVAFLVQAASALKRNSLPPVPLACQHQWGSRTKSHGKHLREHAKCREAEVIVSVFTQFPAH
jgi:hypothetical protein